MPRFRHTADRLADDPDASVAAIFGPQHGFRSDLQDNMIETPHARDARRRRAGVFALQRDARADGRDAARTSTCSSSTCRTSARASTPTSTRWPTACAPPRGTASTSSSAIGRIRSAAWRSKAAGSSRRIASFVGQFPIPLRHGMTIGELARLFNDEFGINCSLDVVPLDGWRRSMYFDETGVPWVMPSPNLPTLDSAIVYPGAVLFEGTRLSEGRGTTRPFELIGAPWIDGERLADAMNARRLPGVHFRPVFFEPTFQKHAQADVRRLPGARARSSRASGPCARPSS